LINALEKRLVQNSPAGYVDRLFNRYTVTFDHRMIGVLNCRVPALLAKCITPVLNRLRFSE
jgi:predicted TPR repeat methyltransferase